MPWAEGTWLRQVGPGLLGLPTPWVLKVLPHWAGNGEQSGQEGGLVTTQP